MSEVFVAGEEAPAMTVHAGYAPAQGAKLCYQVAGSGPPVVLLHGFSFDRRMWDDQMDALTPHHTVVRYDLRGFGESPPGSTPYTHADDLTAVIDHLGIERAAVWADRPDPPRASLSTSLSVRLSASTSLYLAIRGLVGPSSHQTTTAA